MKNIKIFAFLAVFLLSAAVSSAWAWKGSGTSDAPYQITSAADLTQLATDVNGGESYSDKYFKQTADITLSGEWTPIGTESNPFKGHYDGGGFAIRGLRVTGNYKHAGLFGYISSDRYHGSQIFIELKNINIVDCVIDVGTVNGSAAGGIAGETGGPVRMTGNRVRGSITAYGNTGGLIGIIRSNATVSNNFVDVTVSGTGNQYNQYIHPEVCLMVSVSGGSSGGSGNYYHDNGGNVSVSLNTNITATPVYSVTVTAPVGLTDSDANVTLDGVKYYETGKTVTFGFSGSGSVVYFVNGERIEGNSVTVGQEDLTVQIGVPYIDENGKEQIRKPGEFTVLTSTTDVSNLGGGWYVVQGKVEYTNQVKFSGDAHLILADEAKLEIKTESKYGIYASNNLTIYGQNGQSGILNDTANGTGGYGIYSNSGDITIIGGTVEATGKDYGIYSYKGVTINGGTVSATGTNDSGIYSRYGSITTSGGTVRATGDYGIYGNNGVKISGGSVKATSKSGYGIYSYTDDITISGGKVETSGSNYGIYGDNGVTISGGKVETSGSSCGIYGDNGVSISGGTVEASGSSYGIYGNNGVKISGGSVTATGKHGIYSYKGNITLGWTNSTDSIKASRYYSYKGSVQIAEGKSFKDEKGYVYRGTLTGEQLSAIKGKKLEPCYAVTFDAQNGDDPIMLPATFDENGVAHVKKPADPTRDGFSFEGWFTATDGNTEFDFSAAITGNTTAYAKWGVPYIDEKGAPKSVTDYTVLTSSTDVSNLGGGWYVVQGKVKYSNQVKFSGDAHLILADGATMVIGTESKYGIYASNNLTIYGQNEQRGILNDTANGTGGYGICSYNGNITISGGKVTATGSSYGIYSQNGVTINGGSVEATGEYGIYSNGDITLGWTNSTDSIKASSYYSKNGVSIAEGKSFKDEDGKVYRGTLTKGQVSYLEGQKLEPFEGVSVSFVDNFSGASDVFAEIAVDGEGHVSAPSKHPFHSGKTFIGWFTSPEGDSEFDFTVKVTENTTAYAHWNENTPVEYIDENGGTKKTQNYILLTNDIYVEEDLPGGWYVVEGEVKYTNQVTFNGEAHLILADGAEMEIGTESKYGIYASNNLTIYGQNEQRGILNATGKNRGIYGKGDVTINGGTVTATGSSFGIYSEKGNITINGGSVTATGTNDYVTIGGGTVTATGSSFGIYSEKGNITINGGIVTATGKNGFGIYGGDKGVTISGGTVEAKGTSYDIYSSNGVTISGGSVTATGNNGIRSSNGNITLGWTNSTDFIKASSYSLGVNEKHVSIAEGKSFKDEKGYVYRGTLTKGQVSDLKGQKLEPFEGVSVSFVDNFSEASDVFAEIAVDGEGHVSAPSKHPFHSGKTFIGWFTSPEGDSEFDFTVKVTENTTAYAHWNENTPVEYIDENGGTKKTQNYILLTNDIYVEEDLPGGWYVVEGEVKYTNQVTFNGEAHLILADGAKMEIETEGESEYGIYASNNLTIYGQSKQSEQSGILNATAKGTTGSGIYSYFGDITIIGGKVTATGTNGDGIYGKGDVTINGGSVEATGKDDGIYGYKGVTISGGTVAASGSYGIGSGGTVEIKNGSVTASGSNNGISGPKGVTISGGSVTATGKNGYGISSWVGNITFGWTNSTDSIKASSYYGKNGVSIAEGKSFKDDKDNVYSGTLTGEQLSAIKSKKLEPCYAVTFDAQNGDDPIMLLTTFDENGVAHVAKPNDPIRSGFTFEGWFTATDGGTEFDFSAAITGNTTAYAKWELLPVKYIDEDGATKSVTDFIVLTEDNKPNEDGVIELPGGWYVVQGKVKYSNQVKFSGDAHLILADGAKLEIVTESKYGIYASNNLTIYGQNEQRGILNDTANGTSGYGIYSHSGDITIIGGSVTATGYNGIYSKGIVTISGGTVTATGKYYGIYSNFDDITLGWTNSTDSIKASSYYGKNGVSIAEGKSFKDEDGKAYSGTLTGGQLSAIKSKKLEPCYAVTFDAQNGDDPIMLLTTFDENGVAYVAKPADPTRDGFSFEGWFTTTDGNTEFDFSAAITGNTTAYAKWSVPYIDEKGAPKSVTDYTVLTSSTDVSNLSGGWYVVQGKVEYTSQVKFSGDAHLILADGAEMVIKSETYGILADKNLTIYGQNGQSGILNDTANGTNGIGIYSYFGDITISGGKVTATGTNGDGIYSKKGNITINGGTVTASGNSSGINTAGHITLGWTNSTDSIKVSSIYLGADSCTVSIAKGKSFVDENGNEYRDTLTDENLESIKNKTLTPLMPFPDNIVIANISGATYTGDSIRPEPVVTIGENDTLELGKDYTLAYKDNLNASNTAKVIVKGAGKYYGEVQKSFTIDKAPLKITALNDTIVYGEEPANQGVAYDGFVGNETSEVLKGELALEIGYKQYDDAGKYAITPRGLNADNYKIEFVAGTLTVEPKVISIVWGKRTVFGYDGKAHAPTVTAEGFVEGHVARLVVTGAAVEVGNHTAIAAFDENDANSKNYKLRASELEKKFKIVMPIAYIDENGVEQTVTDYTVLTENTSVDNLDGGWYVVQGEVKYTSQVMFSGDAHLILADGATMEIKTKGEYGIYASKNLTIYGQNGQRGILNDTAKGTNGYGIYSNGTVTISGGKVTATGENGDGIHSDNGVTISGGSVTATGKNGIYNFKGNITLGWTNSTDFIYASSYYSEKGSVSIAEGRSFKDEDGKVYSGMIEDRFENGTKIGTVIDGKTLVPSFNGKFLSDVNIAVADIPVQKYADGEPICPSVLVTDGKDTLKAGTDYTVTCVNNTAVTSATLDEAAIAQITGKGNYAGAIQKRFFIWNNIRDYAAVQVFEDEKSKKHAVIDGEYEGKDVVNIGTDISVNDVVFNRVFTPNSGFATIMLPFDVNASSLTGVKSIIEFTGITKVNGEKAVGMGYVWCNATLGKEEEKKHPDRNCNKYSGELKAYTPYMIEMESATLGIDAGVTLVKWREFDENNNRVGDAPKGNWVFRGTLQKKEWPKGTGIINEGRLWAFSAAERSGAKIGEFVQFGGNNWANPFRAYLVECKKTDNGLDCKDDSEPKASQVSRYRFADALAPASSAENSLSAKTPAAVAASETASLNSMDIVIVYGDSASGERPTVIGRMNPATGEIRMLPRTKQTYDLKGRRVNEGRKAKGAYYRRKTIDERR